MENILIGNSRDIIKINELLSTIANSNISVLITGEIGSGKEYVAHNMHLRSTRNNRPFVSVNCGALSKKSVDFEVFGYEGPSFVGSKSFTRGKLEEASEGTIFFREIDELENIFQSKLHRVLKIGEFDKVGVNKKIKTNFRFISSTTLNLREEINKGKFRQDLFFEINGIQIDIPPLRKRKEDIILLSENFLKLYCLREKKTLTLSELAKEALISYHWPGNIRELENVVERAVIFAKRSSIMPGDLPEELLIYEKTFNSTDAIKSLRTTECEAIKSALDEYKGNISRAARKLGISRKIFYKRIKKYNLLDLERLTEPKNKSVITEDEFNQKKKKV
jgi:DNA-binding NtrC family response regulator